MTAAIVASGGAVLIAAAACVQWPVPTSFAQRLATDRLQRPVSISDDATFCLCPVPTLRAGSVEVGPPDWSDAAHFARVGDVEVKIGWRTLFGGRPHVVSAIVGSGDVVLERREDGRASWQFGQADPRTQPRGEMPRIDRLEAREVAWRFVDPAQRADLRGTLSLRDGAGRVGADDASQAPRLELKAGGSFRGLPVDASAEGGGVLPDARAARRPVSVRARIGEGRLSFDGDTDSLASLDGLAGRFEVSGPALAALGAVVGAVLPRTPPFRIAGEVRHLESRWRVDVAGATVGGSDLRGRVEFTPSTATGVARLDGALESKTMRIADLGRSVGFGESGGRKDRVLPDVALDLPSLRNMDARIGMRIARLELGSVAPIVDVAASITLQKGVLAVGELQAGVAGGRLSGDVSIDATESPGRLRARLTIRQVSLERWLPKLRGEPPMRGRLNAELEVQGRGTSVADVLARADGRARLAIGPGRASNLMLEAAGLDIAQALAVLATGDRSIPMECGLVDVAIERGTLRPTVMVIDTADTVLTGDGTASLADERLAMRVRALPRDFSPLTVRAPILVRGTFADPQVSVDRTRIAGTVIAAVILGALVAPAAALLPLLDFGEGDPPSPCTGRYAAPKTSERSPRR